jgi:SAM-dependent methyltransferase
MATEKSPLSNPEQKSSADAYRSFWERTGFFMKPFIGAPSTQYYFECEKTLIETYFPNLQGKKVFKTDLWDEAKNTKILNWMGSRGARVFGIDIAKPIVQEAKASLAQSESEAGCIISDLRAVGFKDESFDCIYSMGTIEHFPEYRLALRECYRLLKKGGIAIIGVPNKFDPFLRPLLVWFLQKMNLYPFGDEKSFGFKELEQVLNDAGFCAVGRSGILFIPGWLRMMDLLVHRFLPQTSFLFSPLVFPFAFLYGKFPSIRRWGYLIACVAKK